LAESDRERIEHPGLDDDAKAQVGLEELSRVFPVAVHDQGIKAGDDQAWIIDALDERFLPDGLGVHVRNAGRQLDLLVAFVTGVGDGAATRAALLVVEGERSSRSLAGIGAGQTAGDTGGTLDDERPGRPVEADLVAEGREIVFWVGLR